MPGGRHRPPFGSIFVIGPDFCDCVVNYYNNVKGVKVEYVNIYNHPTVVECLVSGSWNPNVSCSSAGTANINSNVSGDAFRPPEEGLTDAIEFSCTSVWSVLEGTPNLRIEARSRALNPYGYMSYGWVGSPTEDVDFRIKSGTDVVFTPGVPYVESTRVPFAWVTPGYYANMAFISSAWNDLRLHGVTPGVAGRVRQAETCTATVQSGFKQPLTASILWEWKYILPLTIKVSVPTSINFGEVPVGQVRSIPLPIKIDTDGPINHELFMMASRQNGNGGDIGGGLYTISLPAEFGGGMVDLSGAKGVSLKKESAGVISIDSEVSLRVPSNVILGEHRANLTLTVRIK